MSQPELPTLSFLEAIEPLLADGEITPSEWLAYGKKHASNPRLASSKAREAKAMFDLIMERGLDDFISLAESGLSSARDTEVPTMKRGKMSQAEMPNPLYQEKKEKNVSRMEDTVEALQKLKGILTPAEPAAEPAAEISIEDSSNMEVADPATKTSMRDDIRTQKKAARKAARKAKLEGEEPLIATEAGPPTLEELEAVAGDNQDMFGTGPEAPTLEELKAVAGDNQDMFGTGSDPEDYTDKAIEIFKDLHATEFDPKSRMDRGKLEKMKSMLADVGGIGDEEGAVNKFALQFYRNS